MADFLVNTSWAAALLCFISATAYGWLWRNRWQPKSAVANMLALTYWGLCYVGTQFGPDWFITSQRAFFRLASTLAIATNLYFVYETYKFLIPIIEAKNGTVRPDNSS